MIGPVVAGQGGPSLFLRLNLMFNEQSAAQPADDCSDCDAREQSVTSLKKEQLGGNFVPSPEPVKG